jgi:phenylacetic acid degradation operon negative regulatory protein
LCTWINAPNTYGQKARTLDPRHIGGAEAFRLRTELIDAWRAFPWEDPGLPPELLPREFPLFEARRIFVTLYNSLADTAAAYVEETAVQLAPELAGESRAFRLMA